MTAPGTRATPPVRGGVGERAAAAATGARRSRARSPTRRTCAPSTCSSGVDPAQPARLGADPGDRHRARRARSPGVRAVLTHADVPGAKCIGVSHLQDQPVLAFDRVRHHGEPVAVVAAEDLATARRAAALIAVDYEPLPVLRQRRGRARPGAPALHPDGNDRAHGPDRARRSRPPLPPTRSTVRGDLRGRHAGPGLPRPGGRARASAAATAASSCEVATQWLHRRPRADRGGARAARGAVRLVLAGVGGAFGGARGPLGARARLPARARHRPAGEDGLRARGVLRRRTCTATRRGSSTSTSPAPDGRLLRVRARLLFDGGAYASSSTAVIANAATLACGPYAVPERR